MSILVVSIFVSVVLATYLLRVAALSQSRQRRNCFIKAVAVSVSAGTLAMLAYFVARGLEYQLGLMLFQLILFSAVVFGIALVFALPAYGRRAYLQELPKRMLENLREAGK